MTSSSRRVTRTGPRTRNGWWRSFAASSTRGCGRRSRDPRAQLVFLAPPSWAELVSRLAGRGSEPPAVQERRLALAQAELDASGEFDVVVVNDDVARAADELVGLLTAPSPGLVPGE